MRFRTILLRSLRLRCPRCGKGRLFRGWLSMHDGCPDCGLQFQREPGFFLGSIYFNYGMTALLVTVSYFACFFGTDISPNHLLWGEFAFCLLFPLWFFRYARSLWLGFDEFVDARQTDRSV
jgi:uncharacterized protein (DUF983 family)